MDEKQLSGKRALVFGVANNRSIAWGIAQTLYRKGAEVILVCQNEQMLSRLQRFATDINPIDIIACNVLDTNEVDVCMKKVQVHWEHFDILVHSISYAPVESLQRSFVDLTREDFRFTFEGSVFSFIEIAKYALPLLVKSPMGGSIVTMSYLGANRVMTGYGIMGPAKSALEGVVRYMASDLGAKNIRVNAVSAGPVRPLTSGGSSKEMEDVLQDVAQKTPLRANITLDDVGELVAFLGSDAARRITGATHFVDSGAHIIG